MKRKDVGLGFAKVGLEGLGPSKLRIDLIVGLNRYLGFG